MPASRSSRSPSSAPSDQDSLATNRSSPVASVDGEVRAERRLAIRNGRKIPIAALTPKAEPGVGVLTTADTLPFTGSGSALDPFVLPDPLVLDPKGPLFLPERDTPPPASPPLPDATAVLPGPDPEWPISKVDPRFFVTSDPRDVTYATECTAEAYRTLHSEHGKCASALKESQDLVEVLRGENSRLRREVCETRTHHTEAIVWLTQMRNGIHLLRDSIRCRGCKQIREHMMWATCGHSYCADCVSWTLDKEGYCRIFQCYKYHYEQNGHRLNLAFDPIIHTFWMVERTLKAFDEYQQDQDRLLHIRQREARSA
ncbi:hypothetical protein BKA62DRAFT_775858 [Auriculariales sp. MPI-PUGE-AT-0066]|nr:hypothetical protein BKA62DRAFT_775858 [Auriculariales sp. MPI-PUGE-AT-0066]